MLKIPPIALGSDQLTLAEPVRLEIDWRTRTLQLWLGAAVEDERGVCLGILDTTGERPMLREFPVLENQIVYQDPGHLDPAATDLFEILRAALEPHLHHYHERAAEKLKEQSFRVGRVSVPLDITWQDRDPIKHRQYLDKIEPKKEGV